MTDYPYEQGLDYGSRSGTLGLSFHMSEGTDNLVDFLAQREGEKREQWADRVNGVSCHAALLSDGTIWQMLGWDRACGNLNPYDRAAEYGYYGHHHLVDVLGNGWTNPNEWTISMEIAGYRADGPTDAQVRAAIRWGADMRSRFPTLRGATGHHDQSPKACPGLTFNMKAIFTGVGGHGLWPTTSGGVFIPAPDDSGEPMVTITSDTPLRIRIPAGTPILDLNRAELGKLNVERTVDSPYNAGGFRVIVSGITGTNQLALVDRDKVTEVEPEPAPEPAAADCSAVQADLDAANARALATAEVLRNQATLLGG